VRQKYWQLLPSESIFLHNRRHLGFVNIHRNFLSRLAGQQVKSLETEIAGYKKSIQKEEERNETLTMVLNKTETDISVTKKLIKQNLAKQDALKQMYSTYSRTLHETEQALNKSSAVSSSGWSVTLIKLLALLAITSW